MKKISITNIIKFRRRKSTSSQLTFINSLNKVKPEKKSKSGGDYWIPSLSTLSDVFKFDQIDLLNKKIDDLKERYNKSGITRTRNMYQKNIQILSDFINFNFKRLKPKYHLTYLPKSRNESILNIKGLPVQVLPSQIYSFEEKGIKKIGAVWFVANKYGYRVEELAIFTDALYRYVKHNYQKKYEISTDYCVSVDGISLNKITYTQILNKEVPALLNTTVDSINKVLNPTP